MDRITSLIVAQGVKRFSLGLVALLFLSSPALSQTTASGAPFTLVATSSGGPQLFGLTADTQGRIYIGNNSNDSVGIPVQRFDPTLFSSAPVILADFGPSVGDADGITSGNGFVYVADNPKGVEQTDVSNGNASLFIPGVAINLTGSPLVFRPSDGHLFVGRGGLTNDDHIDEYNASGTLVKTYATGATSGVETMTYDPTSGLIYYAAFGSTVRALNPVTGADTYIGAVSGTIDGGLTFDSISGLLFIGTANGVNSGLIDTINPTTGVTNLFASGFNDSTGILRDSADGDLYFLEAHKLYRIDSSQVVATPEADSLTLLMVGGLTGAGLVLRRRK